MLIEHPQAPAYMPLQHTLSMTSHNMMHLIAYHETPTSPWSHLVAHKHAFGKLAACLLNVVFVGLVLPKVDHLSGLVEQQHLVSVMIVRDE